jgi:hypothetical protein
MRNGVAYQRQQPAHLTSGTGCGLWPTPLADGDRTTNYAQGGTSLGHAVRNWPTPLATDGSKGGPNQRGGKGDLRLSSAVQTWPTPTATQYKGWSQNHNRADKDDRLDYTVERQSFQAGQPTPPMRLNPDWVEKLMGWPDGWTNLNHISHVKMCFWLMGFSNGEETGRNQVLRVLRKGYAAQEVQREIGRFVGIQEATILLAQLCEYANRPYEARVFMACAETLEKEMRGLRVHESIASAPHRPRQNQQQPGEHSDAMQALSRLLAHHGPTYWKDGSWEDAVPRVDSGVSNRIARLKALGNGQVPRVVAAAWEALNV